MKKGGSLLLGFVIIAIYLVSAGIGNAFSQNISRGPSDFFPYGGPLGRNTPAVVSVTLYAHERTGSIDYGPDGALGGGDDVTYNVMVFGHDSDPTTGLIPGPFIRALEGDTLNVTFVNSASETHSIDFHAVMGFKGGATVLKAASGETKTGSFPLDFPGLYMYHCAGDGSIPTIAQHISNGMWGLILVEPRKGGYHFRLDRKRADKEFYIMQSEFYLNNFTTPPGTPTDPTKNPHDVDFSKGFDENPDYVVFNGRAGVERSTLSFTPGGNVVTPVVMSVNLFDDVIIYFGNAGPNLTSSPHMIGGMWDREYHFGDVLTPPLKNIATSSVPAAGTAIYAFKPLVAADLSTVNVFLDHAVFRVGKGALGAMLVQ